MAELAIKLDLTEVLSPGCPGHVRHLVADLEHALKVDAPATACQELRALFRYLLGYFGDLLAATCVRLGANPELYHRLEEDPQVPAESESRLIDGLEFIPSRAQTPGDKLLLSVFLDGPSERPFLSSLRPERGLKLSDFCQDTRSLSRAECQALRNQYLPVLVAWLEAARPFWDVVTVGSSRTLTNGRQRIRLRYQGVEWEFGARCDLADCQNCIPSRTLTVPAELAGEETYLNVPQRVPSHLLHLVDRLEAACQAQDAIEACRLLRDTLEFLLRYFAGVASCMCVELKALPPTARKYMAKADLVDNCERLLELSVQACRNFPDDVGAQLLVAIFYTRNEAFELLPRTHTEMLLISDMLSSWFKKERGRTPEVESSRQDFARYLPVLRDWLDSMGAYFAQVEHFEEEPSKKGCLPLTVGLGSRLLELMEPQYSLKIRQCPVCLPDPEWVTQARATRKPGEAQASAPAPPPPTTTVGKPGEFRAPKVPTKSPRFLEGLLKRLDVYLRRGELDCGWVAARDCMDYMVRYWAGLAFLATRAAGCEPEGAQELADDERDPKNCEALLVLCLKALEPNLDADLSQEVHAVFAVREEYSSVFQPTGSHSRMLLSGTTQNLLSEFCARAEGGDIHQCRRDLKTFLPVLKDWLSQSRRFFEQCEHYEEEPDAEGALEFVVQFDQTYIELISPDYVFRVRPGSDQVPDLEVPELPPEPVEEEPPPLVERPRLLSAEERLMEEPFLVHKIAFIGDRPNSKERVCKSGIIKVSNAGGGVLNGTAFTTHPCLEVSPRRFRGDSQLTYWLDEKNVPKDFNPVIVLRAGNDEREIPVSELQPPGMLNSVTRAQASVLLTAPSVLGMLAFWLVLLYVAGDVGRIYHSIPSASGKLSEVAFNELQQMLDAGQYLAWFYLFLAALLPALTYQVQRMLPPSIQDLTESEARSRLFLPSLISIVGVILPIFRFDVTSHPEIRTMNMIRLLPWFLAFNMAAIFYISLARSHRLDDWFQDKTLRKAAPVVAWFLWFCCTCLATL